MIDAIALFESGLSDWCETVVGVVAPEEVRMRRIMAREGISEEYARTRILAQHGDEWFRERCGAVIDNGGTLEELQAQVETLFG